MLVMATRSRVNLTTTGDVSLVDAGTSVLSAFHAMTGDVSQIYGLANVDALSVKRQRTLPVNCRVYDLLNFASELATHHATGSGSRTLQGWIGTLDQQGVRSRKLLCRF